MSSEINPDFKTTECQEFCIRVADGTHDSPKETEVGKRLITSKNVKGGRLELDSAYLISIDDFESINKRSKVDQWDLLLTMIGTVGEICLVTEPNPDFAIKNVGLLKCGDELKAKWVYYFLRSPQGQTLIEERKKGSTQQYVSLTELRKLPISYPEDEQEMRLIVQSLGCIDDRINLLRETNKTLEAIAQALFKSWFVDFDPVRAKMEGRQPEGMDEATAALFPDSFQESELGQIPSAWGVSKIGTELKAVLGGTPSRSKPEYWMNGSIPWINSGKVNEFRITTPSELITENALKKSATKLLPARTTVLAITGATLGQVSIAEIAVCANQSVIGLPPSEKLSTEYIYFWITANIQKLIANQTGGAQQHINKGNVEDLLLLIPDDEVLNSFRKIAEPLFLKIAENCFQISSLSGLRDTLLPRLISGQLRLPEAEAEVKALTA